MNAYKLKELLHYDPPTGKLRWKDRGEKWFQNSINPLRTMRMWNARFAGKGAFNCIGRHGYCQARVMGRQFLAHRVIWAITYGDWPADQIDHINGDRTDNRIENLRSVSRQENYRNKAIHRNNTSGHIGVSWRKDSEKWQARIGVNGKEKHLGNFGCITAAVLARKAAEQEHGFHKNHGREPTSKMAAAI